MKTCGKCSVSKPIEDFNKAKNGLHGRQRYCRDCQSTYYKINKDRVLEQTRRSKPRIKYGMTDEEVKEFRRRNAGLCEVCHEEPASHIDHDHLTGKVRGHLCRGCNLGLGFFKDKTARLRAAAEYLESR